MTTGVIIEKFNTGGGIMKVFKPEENNPYEDPKDPNPPLTDFAEYLTKGANVHIKTSLGKLEEGDVVEGEVVSTLVGKVKKFGSYTMVRTPMKITLDGMQQGTFGQIVVKYPTVLKVIGKPGYIVARNCAFAEGDIVEYKEDEDKSATVIGAVESEKLVALEQ